MRLIPHRIPSAYVTGPNTVTGTIVDSGGYDVLIGGLGFRFATSTTYPYTRASDQYTKTRVDQDAEPGEQTLSPLPWVKSQSTFHYGAGQSSLEQAGIDPLTSHMRFDTSLNVNPWVPGQVTRLPDVSLTTFGVTPVHMCTGTVAGIDYAIVGGAQGMYQVAWNSGPDAAPTVTLIDYGASVAFWGGNSNITCQAITTDGFNYYALIQLATANSFGYRTFIAEGQLNSAVPGLQIAFQAAPATGTIGWSKARLMAGIGPAVYEVPTGVSNNFSALTPKYTHPVTSWQWDCVSESPAAVLMSGHVGGECDILKFTLDTSGSTPVLSGGATIATLPPGEVVNDMGAALGSFLTLATSSGMRVATFDSYTGAMKYGPVVPTANPVLSVACRDRFMYGGFTLGQADGRSGLIRVDLSTTVDQQNHQVFGPDLVSPTGVSGSTAALNGTGTVTAVRLLPQANRLVYLSDAGINVEGNGPGSIGPAWIRTSRIRYGTTEPKLFKLGRVRGSLNTSQIQVTCIAPYNTVQNCGTFGFTPVDPGEFGLIPGEWEWVQMQFALQGASCVLSTYQVKALPQARRQRVIQMSFNCFTRELDKYGHSIQEQIYPRQRMLALEALEQSGGEIQLVEFTQTTPVVNLVVIEQIQYNETLPPSRTDDFGGVITVQFRTTQT